MNTKISDLICPQMAQSIIGAIYDAKQRSADGALLDMDLNESVAVVKPFKNENGERHYLGFETSFPLPVGKTFCRYLEAALGVPEMCIKAPGVVFSVDLANA